MAGRRGAARWRAERRRGPGALDGVGGFFAALLFQVAIAFNTIPVFWNGLCPL